MSINGLLSETAKHAVLYQSHCKILRVPPVLFISWFFMAAAFLPE